MFCLSMISAQARSTVVAREAGIHFMLTRSCGPDHALVAELPLEAVPAKVGKMGVRYWSYPQIRLCRRGIDAPSAREF